jgi:hypothetical protein
LQKVINDAFDAYNGVDTEREGKARLAVFFSIIASFSSVVSYCIDAHYGNSGNVRIRKYMSYNDHAILSQLRAPTRHFNGCFELLVAYLNANNHLERKANSAAIKHACSKVTLSNLGLCCHGTASLTISLTRDICPGSSLCQKNLEGDDIELLMSASKENIGSQKATFAKLALGVHKVGARRLNSFQQMVRRKFQKYPVEKKVFDKMEADLQHSRGNNQGHFFSNAHLITVDDEENDDEEVAVEDIVEEVAVEDIAEEVAEHHSMGYNIRRSHRSQAPSAATQRDQIMVANNFAYMQSQGRK